MTDQIEAEEKGLSALAFLNRHGRMVLLGDPGSGKSTFVNFVAWCLAGEALGRPDANLELLTPPIPSDNEEDENEPQLWDHGPLLPVRVILRDFAARRLRNDADGACAADLLAHIGNELETATLGPYAKHLENELRDNGGILLLDGLDEVPEAKDRRVQIKRIVEGFMNSFPLCRVLITSRTYAYQNQDWRLKGVPEAVLSPFSHGQIRNFVDRWYAYVCSLGRVKSDDAQGRAELLKQAIFKSERLLELAERPLLLTLMASLQAWRGGSLPEKREELYADTLDLLLDWWEGSKVKHDRKGAAAVREPSLSEWLKTDRDKVRRQLNKLAFEAHSD